MKFNLILFAIALMGIQVSTKPLPNKKYPQIGACYYYDDPEYGNSNLTLICIENGGQHNFFTSRIQSICLNQHDTIGDGYRKSWIGNINFQDCKRPELPNDLFKIYGNIHTVNMSDLGLTSFPVDMFSDAVKLIKVFMSHNELTEIPSLLFYNNVKLSEVDLSFNKIRVINDYAFVGDFNLEKLNFSHNLLTSFDKKIFDHHSKLTHLDISNNQIRDLEADSFENFRNLVQLDLSNNALTNDLKPGLFSSLTNLQTLNLSQNRLTILDANILPVKLSNMRLLSIGNNQLRELIGFNRSRIVNVKIVGINSNRFNCSYLTTLFQSSIRRNLDSSLNQINCSPGEEGTTTDASILTSLSTSTKRSMPTTISTSTSAPDFSTLKSTADDNQTKTYYPPEENVTKSEKIYQLAKENGSNNSENQKFNAKQEEFQTFLLIGICINSGVLFIIVIALISYFLSRKCSRRNSFVYEPNSTDFRDYFVNREYEVIFKKEANANCADAMLY